MKWEVTEEAKKLHDKWSTNPDYINFRYNIVQIIKTFIQEPKFTLIDVGCGSGLIYKELKKSFGKRIKYTGTDIDKGLLAIAGTENSGVHFEFEDAINMDSFGDGSYDYGLCLDVLNHTQSDKYIIAEIARVCKKGMILSIKNDAQREFGIIEYIINLPKRSMTDNIYIYPREVFTVRFI